MGNFIGSGDYTTSGYISVAVVGPNITLSFKSFSTSPGNLPLRAVLTISGNLNKRPIDLGTLPTAAEDFQMSVPTGTDVSLFNTVVVCLANLETVVGQASIP
jgi:hypothetical protein